MRIFGFEINRISRIERKEEDNFKSVIKAMHDMMVELVKGISKPDDEKLNFYSDENFFLHNSEIHKMLLKMIDLYSSNICHSPMICYKLDTHYQQLDDCFMRLIKIVCDYIKLNHMLSEVSEAMNEISDLDDDDLEDVNDVISNSEKYVSIYKCKMYKTFGEYQYEIMKLAEVIDTEYLKVSMNYDFIKNRVHNKNKYSTRAEHNRKFFEYNIKFRADLTPTEIENQKMEVN